MWTSFRVYGGVVVDPAGAVEVRVQQVRVCEVGRERGQCTNLSLAHRPVRHQDSARLHASDPTSNTEVKTKNQVKDLVEVSK